jgi:hypothetical protein
MLSHGRACSQIEAMIAKTDNADEYGKLVRLGMSVSTTIAQLCRSMRITQQSQMKAEAAGKRSKVAGVRGVEAIYEYEEEAEPS